MLTKKILKNGWNYLLLGITLACIVGVALMGKLNLGEKAAIIGSLLAALRAVLPDIRKQGVEAIDALDIPDGSTVTQTTDTDTVSTTTTTVSPPPEQGSPTATGSSTPLTVPIRPKDKGGAMVPALILFAAIGLALCLAFLWAIPARAEQFGGCTADRTLCAGPAVAVTVGQFNLATSKFSGGLNPGVGYGATYKTDQWYATGVAAYLAFSVGGGEPNQAMPSVLLSFANYLRVGAGVSIQETGGPVQTQWRLLFGLGTDFGGSPRYLKEARP